MTFLIIINSNTTHNVAAIRRDEHGTLWNDKRSSMRMQAALYALTCNVTVFYRGIAFKAMCRKQDEVSVKKIRGEVVPWQQRS